MTRRGLGRRRPAAPKREACRGCGGRVRTGVRLCDACWGAMGRSWQRRLLDAAAALTPAQRAHGGVDVWDRQLWRQALAAARRALRTGGWEDLG